MTKESNERADEIGRLHQRVTALETQLADVYSSHSWRMTAPVRAAYEALGWFLRNARRAFVLLGWLLTGQFSRAGNALLPYYQRYVPTMVKRMIPEVVRKPVQQALSLESTSLLQGPQSTIGGGSTEFHDAGALRTSHKSHGALMRPMEKAKGRPAEPSARLILANRGKHPLVSIIAPNYNKAPYLRVRLDSILQQTYRNFEVILLDDASTDNSRDILDEYAQRFDNVRCQYNNENSGNVFVQWKKGLELAQGEIIWIAECDDYCDVNFLARLVPALASPFNIGVAYCQSHFVDEKGHVFGNHINVLRRLCDTRWSNDFVMEGKEYVRRYLRRINVLPNASAVLFRHDLLETIDWGEVMTFSVCGDWWIWAAILQETNLCFCADSLNYFRFDSGTARSKHTHDLERIHEHLRVIRMIDDSIGLSDEEMRDSMHHYRKGLQKHLDKFCANEQELLSLLADMYELTGKVSIRLPVSRHEHAGPGLRG